MTSKIDLFCNEGPLIGERIALAPDRPLLLGRTSRGLHLPDPLVSLEHAEISWTTDRYYITDLGSQSGTFVGETRLGRGEPFPLDIGDVLRVGESTFEVQVHRERPPWLFPAVALVGLIGLIAVVLVLLDTRAIPYDPHLTWNAPVRQGTLESPTIPVPLSFVRQYGIDNRDLHIRRVTDFDKNGIDEMWLTHAGGQLAVTFEPPRTPDDGVAAWHVLGELPPGCYDRPALDLPDQRCGGDLYMYIGGRYTLGGQDGIVVWVRPAPANRGEPVVGAPSPFRFTLTERDKFAGFLSSRGVNARVHYLICEGALPGLRAQVLTQDGEIQVLDHGCVREMEILGTNAFEDLGGQVPAAVAFTAVGHQALIADLTTYLSGAPDGLFLDPAGRELHDTLAGEPLPRVMMRLSFVGPQVSIDPIADEVPVTGVRTLESTGLVPGLPAPLATTVVVPGAGQFRVDPPGCSELEVSSVSWQCAVTHLCMPNNDFLWVGQVGCGTYHPLATAVYGGTGAGDDGDVEVRLVVDSRAITSQVDVLRARVSYRVKTPPSAPPTP